MLIMIDAVTPCLIPAKKTLRAKGRSTPLTTNFNENIGTIDKTKKE